jgi:hypothetical protein
MKKGKNSEISDWRLAGLWSAIGVIIIIVFLIVMANCLGRTSRILKETTTTTNFNECIENYNTIVNESIFNGDYDIYMYEQLCVDIIEINKLKLE